MPENAALQANNGGSESTSTEDDESQPGPTGRRNRRPSAKALASTQVSGKKKMRQKRLGFSESGFGGRSDLASPGGGGSDSVASGSFLAIIANAAVAVDGLKRVRGSTYRALRDDKLAWVISFPLREANEPFFHAASLLVCTAKPQIFRRNATFRSLPALFFSVCLIDSCISNTSSDVACALIELEKIVASLSVYRIALVQDKKG